MSDEGKKFDDIGDSEVGKPYRGKMVVHISVELTKISEEKCRVKRFTTLEDGFIVVEDTLKWIDHIVLEWGDLPPLVIGVPYTDDKLLAKGNKDNIKKKDPNSDEQQKLREKAREKLKERGIKPVDKPKEKAKPDTMQIYVKKEDGLRIPLKVTPSMTVREIKEMCEERAEVPADEQHFDYEGTELEDDRKTLEDYGIKKGHTLDLIPRPMKINVKKIDGSLIPVCVSPAKTIEDVKKKVEAMDKIPVGEQNMEFGGKPLKNSPTLQDYKIEDGDTIDLVPDPITVKVKKIDGTIIEIPNVNPLKKSVADIKKMVEAMEGIPADKQNMEFDDKPLDDGDSLIACGVADGNIIELVPDPITIKIKKIDGTIFELPNVNPLKKTIAGVKKMIEKKESIPASDQNLEFKDEPLDDSETLLDNNIKDGDMLCLVPDPITVNFKLPNGTTVALKDVNPLKSISQVKDLLSAQEGIPPSDQHPEYNGTPLDDSLSLLDCGVANGDTIDLLIPINVKTVDGKVVPIKISPYKNIGNLKKIVEDKKGIPVDNQNMEFKGTNLKNPKSLLDYNIKAGDTIELVPDPNPITLNFKKPDGTKVTLTDVSPLKTVAEVKEMLNAQEGIPPNKQHWEYNGDPVDETQTVQDLGMKDGDTIDLVPMEIKLKHWTGATLYFRVEPDMTLDQLKDLIEQKPPKIKKEDQNITFNDEPLEDDAMTLSDYGIKHGDMVKTIKSPKSAPKDDGGGEGEKKSYLTKEWKEKQKKKLFGQVKTETFRTSYTSDGSFLKEKVGEEIEKFELTVDKVNEDEDSD